MPQPSHLPPSRPDLGRSVPVAPHPGSSGDASTANGSFPAVLAAHDATNRGATPGNNPESTSGGDTKTTPRANPAVLAAHDAIHGGATSGNNPGSLPAGDTQAMPLSEVADSVQSAAKDGKTLPHTMPSQGTVVAAAPLTVPGTLPGSVVAVVPGLAANMPASQPAGGSGGASSVQMSMPGSTSAPLPVQMPMSSGSGLTNPTDPASVTADASDKGSGSKAVAPKDPSEAVILTNMALPAMRPGVALPTAGDMVRVASAALPSGSPAAASPAGNPSVAPRINLPINQAGWDQALGNSVIWMVGRQTQAAQLQINPPHLGPIEVRVAIHNDQTSLTFISAHSQVRDALQSAIPGLREMFSSSGLNLVNVDISQHSFSRDSRQPNDPAPSRDVNALPEADAVSASTAHIGLIDFYV